MSDEVPGTEAAIEITEEYADNECVGEFGEIIEIEERDNNWTIELRTHTFFDEYTHRIQITKSVGNVISHDRSDRFD